MAVELKKIDSPVRKPRRDPLRHARHALQGRGKAHQKNQGQAFKEGRPAQTAQAAVAFVIKFPVVNSAI